VSRTPVAAALQSSVLQASLHSALYVGTIRHRRYFPVPHGFHYPIYMSYIDLDELASLYRGRWFWSVNRRNIVEFRRSDFFGLPDQPLKDAVLARVFAATGERPGGRVCLLAHLRYFGLSFNPVSFYYCFHADGTLHSILAEITNTPWGERHAYVLDIASGQQHGGGAVKTWHWDFAKQFHVSPFLPMAMRYDWRFQAPCAHLRVHMAVFPARTHAADDTSVESLLSEPPKQFDSTLVLGRKELTAVNLATALLRFPFITFGVVLKIYWHAFLLRWKRNPFFDHPKIS
jgi:uncharacterized protein